MLISVIIPFLNEVDGIIECCDYIDCYAVDKEYEIEVIFVDDGSTDKTIESIESYDFKHCSSVHIIKLSKNFGAHAAIRAGIANANGDYTVWIGADLQEPIDMIDVMYRKITQGYDAIYVEKETVKVSFLNHIASSTFASLMKKYAVRDFSKNGINNIMFSRKVADYLIKNKDQNAPVNLQIVDAGFRHECIPMAYNARNVGKSKWTFSKKIKTLIDSFVAFSYMPIRAVSILGFLLALLGIIYGLIIVIMKLANPASIQTGFPTIVALLLFGFGITNISLGIIAEYLWRTLDAAKGAPVFIIDEDIVVK